MEPGSMPGMFRSNPARSRLPALVRNGLSSHGSDITLPELPIGSQNLHDFYQFNHFVRAECSVRLAMSTLTALPQLYSYGHPLDMADDKVGLMRDSSDAADDVEALRQRFATDGYLYMKGFLDRDEVLDARRSLTDGLANAGMLDENFPRLEAV